MRTAILVLVVSSACLVSRKSDQLACTNSNDCNDGRTCQSGYCLAAGASCPAICNSCDLSKQPPTCMIEESGGKNVACPAGVDCEVVCDGDNACGSVTCGGGGTSCTVTCIGASACGAINCSGACSCDVVCAPGSCGANTCPRHGATTCDNNLGICSSSPAGCSNC